MLRYCLILLYTVYSANGRRAKNVDHRMPANKRLSQIDLRRRPDGTLSYLNALAMFLAVDPRVAFTSIARPVPVGVRFGRNGRPTKLQRGRTSPVMATAPRAGLSRRDVMVGGTAVAAAAGLSAALPSTAHAAAPIYQPAPGSLTGKTILITGANTGLGLESAKRLTKAGAKVVVTARTAAKAEGAVADVKAEVPEADVKSLVLDLASLQSVRDFPAKYDAAIGAPVDVLMANAGVMAIPERLTTADGFEKTVGINHLGHFAFVAGMMPALRKAANGFRVIVLSSSAHQIPTKDSMSTALASNLDPKEYGFGGWPAYGISKAANVLFADELQRRFDKAGIKGSAVSMHPGAVQTDLARYLVQGVEKAEAGVPLKDSYNEMNPIQKALALGAAKVIKTVPEGANTQVFLAAAADSNGDLTKDGGKYFDEMKAVKPAAFTDDPDLAAKLWDLSEKLTSTKFAF